MAEPIYPSFSYQPYMGDWSRYALGPEHLFFQEYLPEPEPEPAPEIPTDPTAPVYPVPGLDHVDNNDASDPESDRGQRSMSRAPGTGNPFDDLLPGKSTALSVLGLLTPGPIGAGIGLFNSGVGAATALDKMKMIEDVTGVKQSGWSKAGGALAGGTFSGLSDYSGGMGGYGSSSAGGYGGYMDALDPGVAGMARAMSRQALNDRVGYDPGGSDRAYGDDRDPEGSYGGTNSDDQSMTGGWDYGGEGDYGWGDDDETATI